MPFPLKRPLLHEPSYFLPARLINDDDDDDGGIDDEDDDHHNSSKRCY